MQLEASCDMARLIPTSYIGSSSPVYNLEGNKRTTLYTGASLTCLSIRSCQDQYRLHVAWTTRRYRQRH